MARVQPVPVFTARGFQRSQWSISQAIPFPGKRRLRGEIADFDTETAHYNARTFEQDLVLQVRQSAYELYRFQKQRRLMLDFQMQLADFEQVATVRYEVGEGLQQAVLKAQLEKNNLSEHLLALEQRQHSLAQTLAFLLNRPDATPFLAALILPDSSVTRSGIEPVLSHALRDRPEVRALQAALNRTGRQIELAKKQYLPDFTLSLNYFDIAKSDLTPTMTGQDALGIGFEINVPLWRGKLSASLEQARLEKQEVKARYEHVQTQITTEIQDLIVQGDIERRTLSLYREILIPQAETTLEATMSAYTTGQTDFLNLLDAQRQLYALRMKEVESEARILSLDAAVDRATGRSLPEMNGPEDNE
jgi:outer membrane protein TolC